MEILPILAAVEGSSIVGGLFYLICIALVFWLVWFLLDYIKVPDPFNKVIRVGLMIVAVLVLINFIMGLAGHPIIDWD